MSLSANRGLGDSSRIYHNPGTEFNSVSGRGTGALAPILKQHRKVYIKSIRVNANSAAAGTYSLFIMRRGYNANAGGPAKPTNDCIIPAVTDTTNNWATICPDLTVGGNQPGTANNVAFQVPVSANEFIHEQGDAVFVLNAFDELWINATTTLNFEISYSYQ